MDNPVIDQYGDKRWFNSNRKFHRDDLPAIEYADGANSWYQHGEYHRDDGPAVILTDGEKWWFKHGKRHRTDGPAVQRANGTKAWWLNDKYISFNQWLDRVDISDEAKVMMKLKYG
tara:strand:- start:420 stop:767 length:348 start_codon:yes stop_codon:yes gene_type:complete